MKAPSRRVHRPQHNCWVCKMDYWMPDKLWQARWDDQKNGRTGDRDAAERRVCIIVEGSHNLVWSPATDVDCIVHTGFGYLIETADAIDMEAEGILWEHEGPTTDGRWHDYRARRQAILDFATANGYSFGGTDLALCLASDWRTPLHIDGIPYTFHSITARELEEYHAAPDDTERIMVMQRLHYRHEGNLAWQRMKARRAQLADS